MSISQTLKKLLLFLGQLLSIALYVSLAKIKEVVTLN